MKRKDEYKVISKINNKSVPEKLRPAFSKLKIGDIINVESLYDRFKNKISYGDEQHIKADIKMTIKTALQDGTLEKVGSATVPKWFVNLKTVSTWQSRLHGNRLKNPSGSAATSTKEIYMRQLWEFNQWFYGKEFTINNFSQEEDERYVKITETVKFENIEDIVKFLKRRHFFPRDLTHIINQYLMDGIHEHKKAGSMDLIKRAIGSYFEKNGDWINITYDPKIAHDTEEDDQRINLPVFMTLSDMLGMLTIGKPTITEKAVMLCMFHRGLDPSTLVERFNYDAWEQIEEWFGGSDHDMWDLEKCPVPIVLTRAKTGFQHTGYLDRDAITSLKAYLDHRSKMTGAQMQKDDPLFLSQRGTPISREWVLQVLKHLIKVSDSWYIETKSQNHSSYHVMIRRLLRSVLIDSGCRVEVADHVIGRNIKKHGKLPDSEVMRKEYAKASKKLNILASAELPLVEAGYVGSLEAKLSDALADQKKIEGELDLKDAEIQRQHDIIRKYERQAKEDQRQINKHQKDGHTK